MSVLGGNLEAAPRGLGSFLVMHDFGVVTTNVDIKNEAGFEVIEVVDLAAMLAPLPSSLGTKVMVDGVNNTEANVQLTYSILSSTSQEFTTTELIRRRGDHCGAPVVIPLAKIICYGLSSPVHEAQHNANDAAHIGLYYVGWFSTFGACHIKVRVHLYALVCLSAFTTVWKMYFFLCSHREAANHIGKH